MRALGDPLEDQPTVMGLQPPGQAVLDPFARAALQSEPPPDELEQQPTFVGRSMAEFAASAQDPFALAALQSEPPPDELEQQPTLVGRSMEELAASAQDPFALAALQSEPVDGPAHDEATGVRSEPAEPEGSTRVIDSAALTGAPLPPAPLRGGPDFETPAAASARGNQVFVAGVGAIAILVATLATVLVLRGPRPSDEDLTLLYPYGLFGSTLSDGSRAPGVGAITFRYLHATSCPGGDADCLVYEFDGGPFREQMLITYQDGGWVRVSRHDGPRPELTRTAPTAAR